MQWPYGYPNLLLIFLLAQLSLLLCVLLVWMLHRIWVWVFFILCVHVYVCISEMPPQGTLCKWPTVGSQWRCPVGFLYRQKISLYHGSISVCTLSVIHCMCRLDEHSAGLSTISWKSILTTVLFFSLSYILYVWFHFCVFLNLFQLWSLRQIYLKVTISFLSFQID